MRYLRIGPNLSMNFTYASGTPYTHTKNAFHITRNNFVHETKCSTITSGWCLKALDLGAFWILD